MKYQSITLPDLPYKQLFIEYCKDEYLPFLKDFKPLKYKYDKYKDDLDKGINKLVNYNNELIINRIKLFISRLYVPSLRYDSAYNGWILIGWDNYQNQLASKQADILSNNYRKFIINFLKEYDLIIVDEFYYSLEDEQFAGSKSKGYSLHPRLYSKEDFEITTEQLTIPKNVYNAYNGIGEKYKHKFDNYPDEVLKIKDMLQGWNLNKQAIPEDLKEDNRDKIDAYQEPKDRWFTYSGHGSRVHCQTGNLPVELRPYLDYEGAEVDNFLMFDISNGQPFFLSILMIRELLNLDDNELKTLHDFCLQLQLKGNKEFIANELSKLILHVRKQPYEVDEFLKNIGEKYNDIPIKKELYQLFENHSKQILLWCMMSASGCFYEAMQKGSNGMFETREDLKDEFTSVLNFNNEMFKDRSHKLVNYLHNCFPEIYDYIKAMKGNDYRNYAHQTNLIESKFMIKYLAQELLNEKIPFVPIHDGIMIPESKKIELEGLVMGYQKLELSIPYRFEDL